MGHGKQATTRTLCAVPAVRTRPQNQTPKYATKGPHNAPSQRDTRGADTTSSSRGLIAASTLTSLSWLFPSSRRTCDENQNQIKPFLCGSPTNQTVFSGLKRQNDSERIHGGAHSVAIQ